MAKIDLILKDESVSVEQKSAILDGLKGKPAKYSNHHAAEMIVAEIRAKNADWISPEFFDDVFVGVAKDISINAHAAPSSRNYEGKLVLYNRGLLDANLFTAECFFYFQMEIRPIEESEPERYYGYLDDVLNVFMEWRNLDGHGQLFDTRPFRQRHSIESDLSLQIAFHADKFVIGHELAHHILGDTNHQQVDSEELRQFAEATKKVPLKFGDERERLADALSFHLFLGPPSRMSAFDQQDIIAATFGSLNTLTTISLTSADPYKQIGGYPEATGRFNWAMAYSSLFSVLSATSAGGDFSGARAVKKFRKDFMTFFDVLNGRRRERGEMGEN